MMDRPAGFHLTMLMDVFSFVPAAGPFTVFAPTNKAFSLLSPSELNAILSDPVKLTNLLKRHVVQDLIYTSGLQGFQKAYALDFELLFIYHAKGNDKLDLQPLMTF